MTPYFEFRDFPEGITTAVEAALLRAARSNRFILGEEVGAFEEEFAAATEATYSIAVGNGLDALTIALKAVGVGAGDEVILPANTFIATANAVVQAGGTPILVEPDSFTYNLTAAAEKAVTARTKAILPVHLYGQACEMGPLVELATKYKLAIVEDFAQAQGASWAGQPVGSFGKANATSFYPTKNLGALGDAGAITTSDETVAAFARKYRNYGESEKYHNELIGVNSRLDTLQAAVLRVKLQHLDNLNAERQRLAQVYLQELQSIDDLVLPKTAPNCSHVYHIFNIRTPQRDQLKVWLQERGIHTAIHYPVPIHLQPAYTFLKYKPGDFPVAEELAATSLSLPLFPGMRYEEQEHVIQSIKSFFK
ncbi:DegT/DnrJ/EryC1/StrS family aminotransferase [Pontibacter ruber]|uniref:DegT/DnrJ/EryC1/StrS family aminotransferase n=1 Tax=Pontibacter ruber TaxID=1343895 RepID=A0ABW5D0J2_9BACT|nr:DegT/DnrJ/EryC1/StrS family aminotransferase [Pontibacter ruber]